MMMAVAFERHFDRHAEKPAASQGLVPLCISQVAPVRLST